MNILHRPFLVAKNSLGSRFSPFVFPEERIVALNKSIAKVEAQSWSDTWIAELQACREGGQRYRMQFISPSRIS